MITVIHGEDISSSRRFFIEERQKIQNPIIFYGESLNLSNLAQALESNSLFDITDKEIFIEDFFSKKPSLEFKSIISYLQKQAKNSNITIWESKTLSKSQLNIFKNAVIKLFALPKSLFLFLDELRPQNSKKLISLFHKILETTETELIFYMIIRQFRLLLAISDKSAVNQIDEVARLAPWQKSKLQNQAKFFSQNQLIKIFNQICQMEVSEKTGKSILSLSQAIDFLLLGL